MRNQNVPPTVQPLLGVLFKAPEPPAEEQKREINEFLQTCYREDPIYKRTFRTPKSISIN